jgi:hypothetical protein
MIIMDYEQVTGILVSMRLDLYCSLTPRFLGVVDANAILSSVDNDCRKGPHWRSRPRTCPSCGTSRSTPPPSQTRRCSRSPTPTTCPLGSWPS